MRPQFTTAMLGIAGLIVLLWAGIALVLKQFHADEIASASAAGQHMARVLAEYEASSLRAIDLTLRFLRDEWERNPGAFDQAVARYQEDLKREGLIQVAICDAEGWTLYSRLPIEKPTNFADREYFRLQKTNRRDEILVSEPVLGRNTKQWAIQFSRPLLDAHGRFGGIIVMAMPPPSLETVYRDVRASADDIVTLARTDGTTLARTGGLEAAAGVSLRDAPGLKPDDPPAGSFDDPAAGRLTAYSKVRNYPVTVYVSQNRNTVLAAYYRQRMVMIGIGAVASALLLVLARLLRTRMRLRDELVVHERRAEESRERMMLELHDGAIQSIYAVGMNLERSRAQLDQDLPGAKRTIASAAAHLNLVIQDIRNFIAGHANMPHGEREFMQELERLVPDATNRDATQFQLDIDTSVVRELKPEQAQHLLRIAREGVSNVLRHAYAAKAHISLSRTAAGGVRLEISDDGIGMREDAGQSRGLGLHHIGARGQKLSGRTSIESAPGRGTRVVVEFPSHA